MTTEKSMMGSLRTNKVSKIFLSNLYLLVKNIQCSRFTAVKRNFLMESPP